jgi:hypothetical protein
MSGCGKPLPQSPLMPAQAGIQFFCEVGKMWMAKLSAHALTC